MHETYRMLGREHEADLEREAVSRRLAAEVAKGPRHDARPPRDHSWMKKGVAASISAVLRSRSSPAE